MVDWKKQWELHAPHFKHGLAHINLRDYGGPNKKFFMQPGPGFGDLSHPTTQLMMNMMPKYISSPVIDIGCGSGVLSLSAKLRGASVVWGIDIDTEALKHSRANAKLNDLEIAFNQLIKNALPSPLIFMNMISSEQKIAWKALPFIEEYTLLLSGIPFEEDSPCLNYGKVVEKYELDGWLGFKIQSIRK